MGGADKKLKGKFLVFAPATKGSGRGAQIRAYDLISLHHALRACHIICFENRYELGTIQTPIRNSTIFSVDSSGRRKVPTKDFPPFFQTNSDSRLRRDGGFFRQETGAKSEAILTNFALPEIQKEVLFI